MRPPRAVPRIELIVVNMNWFFLLVVALACAPVLGCLWWVVNSKIRDRRRTRIAERMSQTYYHEAVKVPGREERRARRAADAESTGERAAVVGRERAGWPQDDSSGAGAWPADELDPVEPVCCTPREVAQHDGPCDCWEDTEVFEVRDGLPAVPMVPRRPAEPAPCRPEQPPGRAVAGSPVAGWSAPGQPPAAGPQPGRPPAVPLAPPQPGAMPPAASGAPAGPPPRRSAEWRPPERPQQHPAPRNPVERRPADAQRPPAARPPERPVPPRPADRPQRPPAQRRERYPADRREGRPAQRGERRPVERTAARPVPPRRDTWPPANAVEPASSGKHHRD